MIRNRTLGAREKLLSRLPVTGELVRGSLLERTVRHAKGCPKCARGEGHQVHVLTVSYGGGRVRQFSVRPQRQPAKSLQPVVTVQHQHALRCQRIVYRACNALADPVEAGVPGVIEERKNQNRIRVQKANDEKEPENQKNEPLHFCLFSVAAVPGESVLYVDCEVSCAVRRP